MSFFLFSLWFFFFFFDDGEDEADFGGEHSYTGFTPMQADRITDLYRKMRLGA